MTLDEKIMGTSLLLAMFMMSGVNKIFNLDKTVINVRDKLNVDENISKLGVFLVILIEILAPIIILYFIITDNKKFKDYAIYAVWGLIIFTIVVTIIYHPPDFSNYYKSLAFWANVSLLGGLLLLKSHII